MWTRCGSAKTRAPERRGTPSSGFFTWLVNLLHLDATLSSRLARTRSEPPRTPRRRSGSSASISDWAKDDSIYQHLAQETSRFDDALTREHTARPRLQLYQQRYTGFSPIQD